MPVVTPVDVFTVAIPVLLLAQVPPVVMLPNVVVLPWQTDEAPIIGVGKITATVAAAVQPAAVK